MVNMEDKLKDIFDNTNNWLKYAEAKNGILLALNGTCFFGVLSFFKDAPDYLQGLFIYSTLPTLLVATIILIISFLPILNKFFPKSHDLSKESINNMNLIYWGDIRKLTPSIYLKNAYKLYYNQDKNEFDRIELDYAQQILINSEIANRKFIFFKLAGYIDLISIVLTITLCIITNANNV